MSSPATVAADPSPGRVTESEAIPPSSIAPVSTARTTSRSWVALFAVTFLGVLVFWAFDAMPFMDLPAHAGLIALRHRYGEAPIEQAAYVVSLHVGPYTLFRGLGEALVGIIGPVRAVRAIATLPLLLTPLALTFARRRLQRDRSPLAGFVGITLSFGLMALLGFASYLTGVAILIVVLTLWLELLAMRGPAWKREIVVALAACFLFISHGHAFVIFLGIAGVTALAAAPRKERLLRLRALAPSFVLAAWSASQARGTPEGAAHVEWATNGVHFQSAFDKFTLLVTPTLMTRTGIDFTLGIAVWVVIVSATVMTVRALRHATDEAATHSRGLLAAAAACALAFLVLPHNIGWFGFVDGRFVPLVLMLCFLALRRSAITPRLQRILDRGSIGAAAIITMVALFANHRFQNEARGYDRVLGRIPTGARLLNLPLDADSDIFAAHPFIHYDKLVLAERPIITSDLWFHQGTGVYPKPGNPALTLPESYTPSDLKKIDWPDYRLSEWDYVLIRTRPDARTPSTPVSLELVEHEGGWWLYKRN
jgi:hypothetical protein